jgi:BlaI family transcriptional regulator, penicillinase repressor
MAKDPLHLSKRERQIMEALYRRGEATAVEVLGDLADPPSRTAVRTLMRILEDKGHLTHRKSGREFVYRPTRARRQVARSAFRRLLATFFGGSIEQAVAAYMADPSADLSEQELDRLRALIEQARAKGR